MIIKYRSRAFAFFMNTVLVFVPAEHRCLQIVRSLLWASEMLCGACT